MKNMVIEIKNAKEAILMIELLDGQEKKVGTIELSSNGYYSYLLFNDIPVFILKGTDMFYKSFKIEYGAHIQISSNENDKKIFEVEVEKIVIAYKNDFVAIGHEIEEAKNYIISIRKDSSIRRIEMIKQLVNLTNVRLEEAKKIVDEGKGNVCVTKTQAKYLGEKLSHFVKITKEEA